MTDPGELDALRAEVTRLRRRVGQKVSRLRRSAGVELSGSPVVPIRDAKAHERYNSIQLNAYAKQLSGFLDRKVQFVADREGRPIPKAKWDREYKVLERQYNENVDNIVKNVRDLDLPNGDTIAQYMAEMTPTHRTMTNPAVNSMYDPPVRSSKNFRSESALDKMIDTMHVRTSPGYTNQLVRAGREQADMMLDVIGDPGLRKSVEELSDQQFFVLWQYTGFATSLSLHYEVKFKTLAGERERQPSDPTILEQSLAASKALAEHAKTWNVK